MRFVLRQGSREVIFFSENRFIRFDGPETASNFLLDYLLHADNLARLREALKSHQAWSWIAMRDDATVLDYVSRLLAEGMLKLMADPDGLLPWTWQFRSPTFPVEVVKSDFEGNSLVAEEDETEEAELELEDPVPEPVLPPTFIQVAEMEASGITFLEQMYEMAIDLLRFVGMGGELPSELAPEYAESAKTNGMIMNELAESFGASLDPLAVGLMDKVPTTQAGEQMVALSLSQGVGVKNLTEDMGEAIGDLVKGIEDPSPPTEVGPLLLDEAVKHGTSLAGIASETADTLAFLANPIMPELRPTEVGPQLAEIAERQSVAMEQANEIIKANLELMASLGANVPPVPPEVPGEMVNIASSQMAGVIQATEQTMQTFALLLAKTPPEPAAISQICQQFEASMTIQVEQLTQGTDFVSGEIRNLVNVAPPELHDPSPVGDAFISSAEDQTAGMVRAALAAGESLAGLAAAPASPA